MAFNSGRHFLQIPGPTNMPDRVLRAMDMPTIDHRSAAFGELGRTVLDGCRALFQTSGPVVIFPSSGTGAWEAAIVNTLSPGDRVLMAETGQFATLWAAMARRLRLEVDLIAGDWRHGLDLAAIEQHLAADTARSLRAVMVVHSETSTGVVNDIQAVRAVMDRLDHPALLMVDTVSSLGSVDYQHEAWRVDVTIAGSQKGMMIPPGLGFNAVSQKALDAGRTSSMPRAYWDWGQQLASNDTGFFPYTPATNLLYGLREALAMLEGRRPRRRVRPPPPSRGGHPCGGRGLGGSRCCAWTSAAIPPWLRAC